MTRFNAALGALGAILLAVLAIFTAGGRSNAKDEKLDDQREELDAHERINNAETGTDLTDAERVLKLERIAEQLRS